MRRSRLFVVFLAAIALSLVISGISVAGEGSVKRRIHDQKHMIKQAVQDGSLSKSDAAMLRHNLTRIEEKLEKYKAEDRFTKKKEKKLHARLDENEAKINSMKREFRRKFD